MKNKLLFTLGRSLCDKEYLPKIAKIYEDFFWKIGINEFRSILH